jgi:hypothetical protein
MIEPLSNCIETFLSVYLNIFTFNTFPQGIASFLQAASRLNICVAVSEKILRNSKEEDFERIIKSLYSKKRARAVVMFVDEDNVRKLLRASIRLNKTQHFFWIASDSWGAKSYPVRDQEFAAVNAITILPHRVSLTGKKRAFNFMCLTSYNVYLLLSMYHLIPISVGE